MTRTIIVRRNYAHFIKKYSRCVKACLLVWLAIMNVQTNDHTPAKASASSRPWKFECSLLEWQARVDMCFSLV